MRQSHKTILLWAVLIFMFIFIYNVVTAAGDKPQEVAFPEFLKAVRAGELTSKEVEIKNEREFIWTDGKVRKKATGKLTDDILASLEEKNVQFKMVYEDGGLWQGVLLTWLPLVLVFLFVLFLMRQLQSGGGKAMSFGKSKARLISDSGPKVTFKDVAGCDEAKDELKEIIEFLKDPKKFTRLGGRIPKGVLLMGSPGTGKTLMARAIAGEAGVPFFSISGSDFVEMFVGVGASRVRDLFEQSKKHAPCIIFIDEIDAVGRHRGAGLGGGHDEREQTLNQLLVEMDGFESNEGVILIAATNRPDVLDPALLRPGRFDRRVVVPLPDIGGRVGILKVHTKKVPLNEDVDLEVLSRGTPGFSGADIENMVNEAALAAAREDKTKVFQEHFEYAKDKVLMGAERKSMIISEHDKLVTAYHEAGHTLVAKKMKHADPVHKVTIIPRGRALGLMQQLPVEDRNNLSRLDALDRLAILYGGRIAEAVIFNDITTGAGSDLEQATALARRMVCEWGMSDKLGPQTFGKKEEAIFLGREIAQHQEYSENTAVEIDKEVSKITLEQYARAENVINENGDALKAIAEALIEYETLDGNEVQVLIEGGRLERQPPKVKMPTREEMDRRRKEAAESKDKKNEGSSVLGPLVGEVNKA
ncbi:MAG: cell division protein FtsH [Deltaproteobacteria bacterium RIFOXYB12_FULL_58_9]|nr:MAG: cell division protein FtsH [Deltaproteobacteria bacterium RIFOXYB12_FULL_58_9]